MLDEKGEPSASLIYSIVRDSLSGRGRVYGHGQIAKSPQPIPSRLG